MANTLNEIPMEMEALNKIMEQGYEAVDCGMEVFGENATLGRKTPEDVVLLERLKRKVVELNPELPIEAIDDALNTLLQSKANLALVNANKFYYDLLQNGVDAIFKDEYGIEKEDKVKIIDWKEPENNDFLITRQFKISGEMYNCRADMVLFVNGLPLVFIELKASHKHLENAYNDNIKHYLDAIPQAFYYNAFIVISNGTETKIGSITSPLEHFSDWKKINDEGEAGVISLDTVIKGVFDKKNLLDIIENFILYQKTTKGLIKIVGKNHQFLGVNRAFRKIDDEEVRKTKKLGVFWHTQGSGKSFSMVFLAQKVLRKIEGNWTFLIVTDRDDLDTQIYNNFVDTGAVTEDNVRANSKNNLKKLLSEDHRYVFTMIQKFQGAEKISDRNDIIVFTDEAHRSQYNKLAMDMRKALPNACFLAFTGTPLIRGDEKTKEVFGDYTSIYNFEQSILDKATVKLYYENRRPDLQIVNPNMEEEIQAIIDEAELTEEQEERFASKYANMYQAITRDDRLDKVAQDIVTHFMGRGYMGKAMYIAIDKPTAVRMCDKVQYFWKEHIKELEKDLKTADEEQRRYLQNKIDYMKETDMTVVVSASQNEIEYCKKRGADITPYRLRINKEGIKNIENRFKDADDPLRIVFVCSMWITGFDAKCVSTMYLDKILKDHTLMQTIARANRVAKGKNNGIIVDYIGIFNALQKALAVYGNVSVGDTEVDDNPAIEKAELVCLLDESYKRMQDFCKLHKIDVKAIIEETDTFKKIAYCDDAVEIILENDKTKADFQNNVAELKKLLKAVLPDIAAEQYIEQVLIVSVISAKINAKISPHISDEDIESLADKVREVLNKSIKVADYQIEEKNSFDLTKIDFDLLRKRFASGKRKTVIEQIKAGIQAKIFDLAKLNRNRLEFMKKYQELLDAYNSQDANLEQFLNELIRFTQELTIEEKRHIEENLTEEELAVYDILMKPAPELTKDEIKTVKQTAKELLATLKREKLIAGWRRMQSARAKVKVAINDICDKFLPSKYDEIIFKVKCDDLYMHFYDNYQSATQNVYIVN